MQFVIELGPETINFLYFASSVFIAYIIVRALNGINKGNR